MKQYLDELDKIPLFQGIEDEDVVPMLGCISYSISDYSKGDYIILEDQEVSHIGVVLSGKVDMLKEDVWGNITTLMRVGRYETFGETFACGSNKRALISFRAASDAVVMFIPFSRVMHTCSMVCKFHHRLIENMVNLISNTNQELMRKIEVIAKKTLREKIMAYLSLQSQLQQSKYFDIPLGRIELAEYLCADRSALSRELSRMRDEGIIDYDKNTFRLL